MNVPNELKYTKSHEWLRIEGPNGRIGITDHAQSELTDVVYVELPKVGAKVEVGQPVAVVESVKVASDIYAPVSGTIVEVNAALESNPGQVNSEPYGSGWLFVVQLTDPAEAAQLLDSAAYSEQIA